MKNILLKRTGFLLLIATLGLLYGCKDALEENVYSFVSASNFYKTASDADAAVLAIYSSQSQPNDFFHANYINLTEYAADQVNIARNPVNIAADNWQYTPTHSFVVDSWTSLYRTINRANTAINRIPAIEMAATQKASLLGEAYFIRAWSYFFLVRMWGSVPLSLNEIDSKDKANTPKAPIETVYQQIIADLLEAEKSLPATRTGNEVGRVVKTTAQTLLADVYLTQENWQAAADKANEVIQSGQHQLLSDFASIFSLSNENNREIIYSIQFDGVNVRSALASFAHAFGTDNPNCNSGVQVWSVETGSDMWKNWDRRDGRRNVSVYDTIVNKRGQTVSVYNTSRPFPAFGKYNAPAESGAQNSPVNVVVYRYADVLLMFAEATNQANGGPTAAAYNAINQVRRRGYNAPITAPSPFDLQPGLSAQEFRNAVIRERSLEFVLEGKRLFDLKRTGQFPGILSQLGKPYNQEATLLPIPQTEIDANDALENADQNPGY